MRVGWRRRRWRRGRERARERDVIRIVEWRIPVGIDKFASSSLLLLAASITAGSPIVAT